MMTIKQFESATGLKRSTVRFYEEKGLLKPEAKANGYRLYGSQHIEAVAAISLGQALGFSIREIKELMDAWSGGGLDRAQKRMAIETKLQDCIAKRKTLDQLIDYLGRTLDWIDADEPGDKPTLKPPTDRDLPA